MLQEPKNAVCQLNLVMQKKKDFPYSQADAKSILKKGIRAKWPHNRNLIGLFFLFIPITQSRYKLL